MASFISVRNLRKRYGDFTALKDVSLDVHEGEFLALLGPSGCGKTTLLRSIAGFIDGLQGEILLDGKSMRYLQPNQRPVNTVFQNYALFPHLTVGENVAYGPRRNGQKKAAAAKLADESLATVGMKDFKDRYPSQLSGGQQQRVALARAIANRPKVLLLDEPLGALDLKLRKRMQIELKTLQQSLGMTFIFVTHDQEEALVMADRIAVMEAGEIVQIGTGREIYHNPASRYVADFIGDANLLECREIDGHLVAAGGAVKVERSEADRTAAKAIYLLRPEAIRVSPYESSSDSESLSVAGLIRDVVFVGNSTRLIVNVNDTEFVCQFPSAATGTQYAPGQNVFLTWAKDAGQVLSR
ncbi:ABC transporter ATP-binding protein [Limoniibacter endophyticus]|uniref:Spermidine/putrescine import ATP-binding protein PotA n=2 Tax=Limoniibacter endophyticus TaxID=1565040 RepID=A0A8J3DGE5_9HYPH|nr:ABC transporter ATP-binding protein [Limoniibacter endophyticus]GHC63660.1 spermidine/putrescine ABC transporter ATP-binding protein [Limoniibacter endophyticus]